jgi:putative transposase
MCRCLSVKRSTYYKWTRKVIGPQEIRRNLILQAIKQIMEQFKYRYGIRRVHEELKKRGYDCSKNLVADIMKKNGIRAKRIRRFKKTTDSSHKEPVSPNWLNRDFKTLAPNEVWTSDITYLRTKEGWLYLCVFIDLYSRKIVGWSIANHMRASFVCEALQSALDRRPGARPMVHSDRGSQYASGQFRTMLWNNRLLQSMSGKGDCWDNAPSESFFSTLKLELDVYLLKIAPELRQEVFEYIEIFYNRQRIHSTNGYRTPEEVENEFWSLLAVS